MSPLDAKKIYFLGIGGIGMSAVARFFHLQGKQVSGYDRVSSVVSQGLEAEGMTVYHTLDPQHIDEQEVMVYTPAITADNVEYQAAVKAGIPIYKRAQVLGDISRSFKTIAVAGTHGKTSTSAMLSHFMRVCGLDCTAFLGGISNNLRSNFVYGQSDYVVVEADEFDRSFLTLSPEVAIITSLDADHLDIYGTHEEMKRTFREFAAKVSPTGKLLVYAPLQASGWHTSPIPYGIEEGTYRAERLRYEHPATVFDFVADNIHIKDIHLPFPGAHNVMNAVAAMSVVCELGLDTSKLKAAAESFTGIYRRFDIHHHSDMLTYIDDYAHHPTELEAAIDTARNLFPDRQLVVVFQPHLYSRTKDFYKGFAEALSKVDVALMMDIYPARELPIEGVDSQMVLDCVSIDNKGLVAREALVTEIEKVCKSPTVLMTLGAGDIDKEVNRVSEWVKNKSF